MKKKNKRRNEYKRLTLIELPTASMEIHIRDTNKLGALNDLPEKIKHKEYRQADISRNERVHIPFPMQEDLESVEQRDHRHEEDPKIGCVGLEGRFIGECVTVDVIVFQTVVESDVGDQDDVPGDEACDRADIDEPLEYDGTAVRDVEVR